MNSIVVDILFDYEVFLAKTAQALHQLPDLKRNLMNELASALGCQASSGRNLRRSADDEVLLGFHSAEGSDVIDGEKGSCNESSEANGDKCVPVIGNLAAFVQRGASFDAVQATKNFILQSIQDNMASSSQSNLTQRIVYVSEHGNEPNNPQNNRVIDDDSTKSSNTSYIAIVIALLFIVFAVAALMKRKQKMENDDTARYVGRTTRMSLSDDLWCENGRDVGEGVSDEGGSTNSDDSSSSVSANTPSRDDIAIHSDEDIQSITEKRSYESGYTHSDEDMLLITKSCSYESDGDMVDQSEPGGNGGVNFVLITTTDLSG
eukprot:CAMPEP_0172306804 /NCGR_PEP_ID=MMETSP1058-20130122/7796_1 /TAXON_ID=83371 /ORGANISM="Detonula confervacea, Strain CCMP 353" /LENGTH=318 /DNA_ID=CAMNT_0013018799 /DNA_START=209 /DNA_END=1165 /DNA_ORIENTATION=+